VKERKIIENRVTIGNGHLWPQAKQIRKVKNTIFKWCNGLDLKFIERLRNLKTFATAIISSSS